MRDKFIQIGSQPTYYSGLDDLSGKTEREKIEWFRGRFSKLVLTPLNEVRTIGNTNQLIFDLNLGVVTLICTAIEALGSFYAPQAPRDKTKFVSFVDEFMNPKYREKSSRTNQTYSEILYEKFRCGLAHGMSIEGHEVASRPEEYISDDNGYVSIDLWTLFEDMKQAFEAYIGRVASDDQTKANFFARFHGLFEKPYQ